MPLIQLFHKLFIPRILISSKLSIIYCKSISIQCNSTISFRVSFTLWDTSLLSGLVDYIFQIIILYCHTWLTTTSVWLCLLLIALSTLIILVIIQCLKHSTYLLYILMIRKSYNTIHHKSNHIILSHYNQIIYSIPHII